MYISCIEIDDKNLRLTTKWKKWSGRKGKERKVIWDWKEGKNKEIKEKGREEAKWEDDERKEKDEEREKGEETKENEERKNEKSRKETK